MEAAQVTAGGPGALIDLRACRSPYFLTGQAFAFEGVEMSDLATICMVNEVERKGPWNRGLRRAGLPPRKGERKPSRRVGAVVRPAVKSA